MILCALYSRDLSSCYTFSTQYRHTKYTFHTEHRSMARVYTAVVAFACLFAVVAANKHGNSTKSGTKTGSVISTASYASLANAVTAARAAPQMTTFMAAVNAAGVAGALTANTSWTILAPTNKAFEMRLAKLNLTAAAVLNNKDLLTRVLSYHVIPSGAVLSSQLRDNATVATALQGATPLTVRLYKGYVVFKGPVNMAKVTTADIRAGRSVIHVISDVLLPPGVVSAQVAQQWREEWEAKKADKKEEKKTETAKATATTTRTTTMQSTSAKMG